jgi:hypothetical protein
MSILTQQWSGGAKNFSDHGKDIAGRGDHGVLSLRHSFRQYPTRRHAPLPVCLTILPQRPFSASCGAMYGLATHARAAKECRLFALWIGTAGARAGPACCDSGGAAGT